MCAVPDRTVSYTVGWRRSGYGTDELDTRSRNGGTADVNAVSTQHWHRSTAAAAAVATARGVAAAHALAAGRAAGANASVGHAAVDGTWGVSEAAQ